MVAKRPEPGLTQRAPGLITTNEGTLLASWQLRKGGKGGKGTGKGDGDFPEAADNVVSRSTDGGATWSEPITIISDPGVAYHNGPMVVDRKTGAIFHFAKSTDGAAEPGEGWGANYVSRSDDDGKTWMRQELKLTNDRADKRFGPGNGCHGIQLSDGTLIIQFGYWRDLKQSLSLVESRNNGETWQLTPNSDLDEVSVESCIAETAPGKVYLNIREKAQPVRPFTTIEPGRTPIASHQPTVGLPTTRTSTGLTKKGEGAEARLYLTAPTGEEGDFVERRRGLTLFRSDMEGRVWEKMKMLEPGAGGHSDVVVLPNGDLGVVYESGANAPLFEIRFIRVPENLL